MWFKSSFKIPVLAVISFSIIVSTTSAYADLGDQLFKLLPSDGSYADTFGVSVVISSTTRTGIEQRCKPSTRRPGRIDSTSWRNESSNWKPNAHGASRSDCAHGPSGNIRRVYEQGA